ncbi:MAG: lamin tail domain-containing protein [Kiritimatiellae bacterium]|nr:lamin tail domain-containing protein [Kiritimatiellia bacterium]
MNRKLQLLISLLACFLVLLFICYQWYSSDTMDSPYKFELGKKRYETSKKKFVPRTKSAIRSANFLNMDAPVMINEIGIAGPNGYRDMLGRPVDWIELCNTSKKTQSLSGYSLSDTFKKKQKWFLPDITLDPEATLVVTADGRTDVLSYRMLDDSNVVGGYVGWRVKAGFTDSFDGGVLMSTSLENNQISFIKKQVSPMSANIWLRTLNLTNTVAELSVKINNIESSAVSLRVNEGYQIVLVRNPESADGSWKLDGDVNISLSLKTGSIFIDTITLTDASEKFGEGTQDLNSNLSLKDKGELVVLYGSAGQPVDYVSYPELEPGQAYTRISDGNSKFEIGRSTINKSIILKMPEIISKHVFTNETSVTIVSDDVAQLFYTLDGQEPDSDSALYHSPLTITNTVLLKVVAQKDGAISSAVSSKLIWKAPLPKMPLVWVGVNDYNLMSKMFGIIRNPLQRGRAVSERPCYAAVLYPDGKYMDTYAGIRIQGRSSRWLKERKGYRIKCRREYGAKYWDGQLFKGKGPELTQSIVLGGGKVLYEYIGYEAMRDADVHAPRIIPSLMFFNNHAMGFRFIKEDPNSLPYLEQVYGTQNLDVIKEKSAEMLKHGTMNEWQKIWGKMEKETSSYSKELTWQQINNIVDPTEFASWVSTIVYLSCGDNGQGCFVKYQQENLPQWSFICWDMDASLQGTFEKQGFQQLAGPRYILFRRARKKPQFSELFKKRLIYLLENKYDSDKYISMLKTLQNNMEPYYKYDAEGSLLELGPSATKTSESIKLEYETMFNQSYDFLGVQSKQLLDALKK